MSPVNGAPCNAFGVATPGRRGQLRDPSFWPGRHRCLVAESDAPPCSVLLAAVGRVLVRIVLAPFDRSKLRPGVAEFTSDTTTTNAVDDPAVHPT